MGFRVTEVCSSLAAWRLIRGPCTERRLLDLQPSGKICRTVNEPYADKPMPNMSELSEIPMELVVQMEEEPKSSAEASDSSTWMLREDL